MRSFQRNLLVVFCACIGMWFATEVTRAATTDWKDLGGGKARLVASLDPKSLELSGILEVSLEPGWTTYWRYPGSSGIPPRFDFSQSLNFRATDVRFPTPLLIEKPGLRYAGYTDHVSFPFKGEFADIGAGSMKLDLLIGVCEEICIPAQASFELDIKQLLQSDPATKLKILSANLTVPRQMPGDKLITGLTHSNETLIITVDLNTSIAKPDLFVEGPEDWYLQPAKLIKVDAGTAWFELDVSNVPTDQEPLEQELRFTLGLGTTGMEAVR